MAKKSIGVLLVAVMAFVACGDGGKAAADAAMQALQSSYEGVKVDAAKYVPEQAKGIDAALAAVRETVAQGDYMKAVTEAQALTSKVSELGTAIAARKTALTSAFDSLNGAMPAVVTGLQTQVDTLAKAKKLPAGVTKEAVEAAKVAVPGLSASWDEAAASFKAANLTDAVAKAQAVKAKAVGLMTSLGMTVPEALK